MVGWKSTPSTAAHPVSSARIWPRRSPAETDQRVQLRTSLSFFLLDHILARLSFARRAPRSAAPSSRANMRLYYRQEGQGEPLIILHGLLGSSDNWRAMSKRLARHFAVYSLDLRNHGHSPHAAEMNYTVMAEDIHEFIEAYGLSRCLLLGHSVGAKVAMQFAATYPDEVEKLVVVDIAPKAYSPSQRVLLAALRALDLTRIGSFTD